MRFLSVLFPYFFPTQTAIAVSLAGEYTIVSVSACARFPDFRIPVISFFRLIRRYFILRYAETCFLPLFLLLFSVLRPPCVFIL